VKTSCAKGKALHPTCVSPDNESAACITAAGVRALLEDAGFNQSPPFADGDLAGVDAPLIDAAKRAGLGVTALSAFGRGRGSAESFDLA
jgi:hypothetical protein